MRHMAGEAQRLVAFVERSRLPVFAAMSGSESPLGRPGGS